MLTNVIGNCFMIHPGAFVIGPWESKLPPALIYIDTLGCLVEAGVFLVSTPFSKLFYVVKGAILIPL